MRSVEFKIHRRPTAINYLPIAECGIPNKSKRIVGGVEAEVLHYPWMAVMMYGGRFYCGGALISGKLIFILPTCSVHFIQPFFQIAMC